MKALAQERRYALGLATCLIALLGCIFATTSGAQPVAARSEGWKLEQGVDQPNYAVIEPVRTNLNIDSIVLACEEIEDRKVLQLQIYLTDEGPLLPKGVSPRRLKHLPRAEILIDGRLFPVGLFFADDYAVLADEGKRYLLLSNRLVDAMEAGKIMILRFDLVAEPPGRPAAFEGEAVVDLQAGAGGKAIATLRRCAGPTADQYVSMANAGY